MEDSQNLIVDLNITHERKIEYLDWALYDNNIFELLDVCPKSYLYSKKALKFINMFPNIKKNKIANHESHEIYIVEKHTNLP
jgi:hypothetical protein